MLKKPDKYGSKVWLYLDVDSHYVFNAFPYLQQQPTEKRPTQIGAKVVLEFQSNTNREVGSSLFGFQDGLTIVWFLLKNNKAVLLLTSKHHDSQVDNKTGKPIVVLD